MLRNNIQSAFCGLIILFFCGCSNTVSLLDNSPQIKTELDLNIKAKSYEGYRIRGIIEKNLPTFQKDLSLYKINIEIHKQNSSAVYTEKQVAKQQLRMSAKIQVLDKTYNEIGEKYVDAFSTYEVCDDIPFSVLASEKQAQNSVLDELGNSIVFAIVSIIKSDK